MVLDDGLSGWCGVLSCCLGSLRVPQTPWAGPERRPTTQRTELFLMALSLGYGGVNYICLDWFLQKFWSIKLKS